MNDEQNGKIDSTVSEFLCAYDPVQMPFSTISKFVERLKADPNWTPQEIIEMQTRLLRIVLYRLDHPGGDSTPPG